MKKLPLVETRWRFWSDERRKEVWWDIARLIYEEAPDGQKCPVAATVLTQFGRLLKRGATALQA